MPSCLLKPSGRVCAPSRKDRLDLTERTTVFRTAPRLLAVAVALRLLAGAAPAAAHCDTLSGPVVVAARAALETKNLQPLLRWVKPAAEAELSAAFRDTLSVRSQGGQARELADRYFLETVVRLHRAGEGAPYTGLKAEADDPGGMIAASDKALETTSGDPLLKLVTEKVTAGLRERYERVMEARAHADHNVEAGRRYVEAYIEYVHYVEALQQLSGKGGAAEAHRHDK